MLKSFSKKYLFTQNEIRPSLSRFFWCANFFVPEDNSLFEILLASSVGLSVYPQIQLQTSVLYRLTDIREILFLIIMPPSTSPFR
jgi:hypothetical protein